MIIVTKRNFNPVKSDKYYKCTCSNCNSEFYFTAKDTTTERQPNGKSYVRCPVCSSVAYLAPEIFRKDNIKDVSEEEYLNIVLNNSHTTENSLDDLIKRGVIQC